MEILGIILIALILCFGFVILFGAPYLPTLSPQVTTALDLAHLKPGEHLLELGCGDGRVLIAAANRGLRATGYEINPLLALVAWIRTRRHKGQVQVVWGNFWTTRLPPAQGIFVFLLPKYMEKLDKKIVQEYTGKNVNLVSFAFEIPSRTPAETRKGVFLYRYR